jgi:hypothetical protein
MSETVPEPISRFVNAFTRGKVVTKKLLEVRDGKIKAALDKVQQQIDLLRNLGVQDHALDQALATLVTARATASTLPDAKRYEALEQVKQKARDRVALAQLKVDQIRQRLTNLQQTSMEAWTAIKEAKAAIQQTPDPTEKRRFEQALAVLEERHTRDSHAAPNTVIESTEIAPAIAKLTQLTADAQRLAAGVTALNALAPGLMADRVAQLGRIDKELAKLTKLNQKVVDASLVQLVTAKLADLTTRRDALAQAPPGQLQAQLATVPALLQAIANAVNESEACGKWGERKPEREMILGACNHYITAADPKNHNKPKLVQDSLTLRQALADTETQVSGNPGQAVTTFDDQIRPAYAKLKKEYYDEILRQPLLTRAELLEKNDPNCAEAQMKLALNSSVYETRMLEAWNTGEAFGSPLLGKLSPGEALAIYTYTSNDFEKINGRLLGYKPPANQAAEAQIKIMTEQATKALAKLDNYVGITKRGDKDFNGADAQFALNNTFKIKAFWSTGVGYSFPYKWQTTIHGKTGKDIKPISNFPKEAEVLFPPGTEFKVIDRDDSEAPDTIYVTVEEV